MQSVEALLEDATKRGQIPGAVFGVVQQGGERVRLAVGQRALWPSPEPASLDTYYDLASLTKVLFTLREVLRAAEEGLLDLDDPLRRHLPEAAWLQPCLLYTSPSPRD